MARSKSWSEMSPTQRKVIGVASAIEIVLLAFALIDLRRRPASRVRGSKRMWAAVSFVQPVGPIAYLLFGRR
jgi:hypothetical protein